MLRNYSDLLEKSLDESRLELLHLLAYQAVMLEMPIYLVGGVVRDILLGYPIREFDLVIEGDSTEFAEFIVKKFGGRVMMHPKFGTATWVLNDSTLKRLNFPSFELSDFSLSFDLISARSETYSHPGALPTISRSNIDDDLRRRDFTINAMAIRLDGGHFGELLDPLGGEMDLEQKLIRFLHKGSFIDDPTRMFRAVRYAMRYGFDLEPDTRRALYDGEARTILSQLSGERIRHEFDLIFEEANPVEMLEMLKGLNILTTLHPAFRSAECERLTVLTGKPDEGFGKLAVPEILSFRQTLGWTMYLISVPENEIDSIAERLAFPALLTKSVQAASSLLRSLSSFKDWKPSQWTFYLDELPSIAIHSVWLITSESVLREYLTKWRNIKPFTNGDELKTRGLEPGPKYKEILTRLRAAWLDGEVATQEEETAFCDRLIAK